MEIDRNLLHALRATLLQLCATTAPATEAAAAAEGVSCALTLITSEGFSQCSGTRSFTRCRMLSSKLMYACRTASTPRKALGQALRMSTAPTNAHTCIECVKKDGAPG